MASRGREQIRQNLMTLPAWQLYDVARRWYCPYCARATEITVAEGGRISTPNLRELERHLASCDGFARGRGEEKSLGYLKSMVAYANRTRKMSEQILKKIESDAAWRLRDAEGRWVCPYCRKVQEHIDFSAEKRMVSMAPLEIAKHLIAGCARFLSAPAAASQSSATLEIARLGTALTKDIVSLSGEPPAAVSGEFASLAGPVEPARPAPPSPAESRARRRGEIEESLSVVRSLATPATQSGRQRVTEPAAPLPEVDGLELRAFYRGAQPTPLDFAMAVPLDERSVVLATGSVAGEGTERSLVLPIVKNLLRMHAKKSTSPRAILCRVNADLCADLEARTQVELVCGVLDLRALVYRFARAGANPPLLFNRQRKPDLVELESSGVHLGEGGGPGFDASIEEREERLRTGDLVVQFTEGTILAEDVEGKALGIEKWKTLIRRYGGHEADYLCVKFASFFEDWTRGAPLTEDACFMAVKVKM